MFQFGQPANGAIDRPTFAIFLSIAAEREMAGWNEGLGAEFHATTPDR
jgi:hypothetical protein